MKEVFKCGGQLILEKKRCSFDRKARASAKHCHFPECPHPYMVWIAKLPKTPSKTAILLCFDPLIPIQIKRSSTTCGKVSLGQTAHWHSEYTLQTGHTDRHIALRAV